MVDLRILWNSMTSTSFGSTELANTMKYGRGFLYNLVFTEWRHCVSQNEVWGKGVLYKLVFTEWRHCVSQNEVWGKGVLYKLVFTEWRHCVSQNYVKRSDVIGNPFWTDTRWKQCYIIPPPPFFIYQIARRKHCRSKLLSFTEVHHANAL